jgi:hypothetical protein
MRQSEKRIPFAFVRSIDVRPWPSCANRREDWSHVRPGSGSFGSVSYSLVPGGGKNTEGLKTWGVCKRLYMGDTPPKTEGQNNKTLKIKKAKGALCLAPTVRK